MTAARLRLFICLLSVLCLLGALPTAARAQEHDPADDLDALPGFKVETVLKADPHVNGSWISLAVDNKRRLLIGGQRGQPITRVTLQDGKLARQEQLKLPVSEVMGMLYAFDSLYVDAFEGKRFGLFRLRDTKGDGEYDSVQMLREWHGGSGEHGAHGIVLGPDKKLYTVCGNFTDIPDDLLPTSPHRNYADDIVLPRAEDGNGFGAGKRPPGGFIVRMDENGQNAELFAAGMRNTYDIGFTADGELFGFDSDMEWDWGTPWYRPIRVLHEVSAGDYGFREGTAKWPEYYPDSLPSAVAVGIGSPTGVISGVGARFPARYQKAMYMLDWTYGRLIAVHLTPQGASYKATWENLVWPKSLHSESGKTPLNLTDVVIGPDGALYFTVGGRSTQSYLYRVSYAGNEPTAPADLHDAAGSEARELRHRLESFHGHQDPAAVDSAWPCLGSDDRFIRYAARIAIEAQPLEQWKQRALTESKPQAALNALLALARVGSREDRPGLVTALARFPLSSLPPAQQLEKLRALEVSISRQGKPGPRLAGQIIGELDPQYPAKSFELNRELCQLLLALDAPDAVAKTMKLLAEAPTQEEQVGYVLYLRTIKDGWTPELRRQYFAWWTRDRSLIRHPDQVLRWFEEAGRPYTDGASFNNFLARFHEDARNTLTPQETRSLADVLAGYVPPNSRRHVGPARARPFVKEWKMSDLEPLLPQVGHARNFDRGKAVFEEAQCLACHKFGNEGGAVGPDLTAVSSRYTRRDVLESIILPSKVISEQYQNTVVRFKEGGGVVGRVVEETPERLVVQPSLLSPEKITVEKSQVKSREPSKVSPMPDGLVNNFTRDEILDMIAYIESGGRRENPDFKR